MLRPQDSARNMELIRQFEATGLFLFRFRSQIPVLTLLVFFLVMRAQGGMTSKGFDLEWELACLIVSMIGYGIRLITLGSTPEGTSGRNRHHQVAHSLNTTGMYSVVRHPLYLGNFIIFFGISLVPRTLWVVAFNAAIFWVFYLPIMFAEEQFLERRFGDAFHSWARLVPSVIPRFCMWRTPERAFDRTTAIRREYQTLFAILAYYALLGLAGNIVSAGQFVLDPFYGGVFVLVVAVFVITRHLIKTSRLFPVPQN
jgi:protein-S-isoprenylcysteine O-methyltransferase Ste14